MYTASDQLDSIRNQMTVGDDVSIEEYADAILDVIKSQSVWSADELTTYVGDLMISTPYSGRDRLWASCHVLNETYRMAIPSGDHMIRLAN